MSEMASDAPPKEENPEHINLKVKSYLLLFSNVVLPFFCFMMAPSNVLFHFISVLVNVFQVMGQDGNIVQFKIKKHTALKKLMATYCERAGLAQQTIRFSFDGTRINESDSPKSLDMEDGDTIEVFQQQSGGTNTEGSGNVVCNG